MANTINLECKNCGATLTIDADRTTAFCTYCGAKIDLLGPVNRTETVIHNIDEARLKEVDANERLRSRELDLEDKKLKRQMRKDRRPSGSAVAEIIKALLKFAVLIFLIIAVYSLMTNRNLGWVIDDILGR